jgi:molybdopterin-guanine dinucleotide biosynthesis protein A
MEPPHVSSGDRRELVRRPFGAILGGGASRRFGSPKALAPLGGLPVAEHVRRVIESVGLPAVLIANQPDLFAEMRLRTRGDVVADAGPLAGIHATLTWARDEGRPGALCIACDMPFVSRALLARLLSVGVRSAASAVIPESTGRRGTEPLCAFYAAAALDPVERMLRDGERRASEVVSRMDVELIPLHEVRSFGDPEVMFLNVNTPDDLRRAEQVVRERREGA